MIPLLKRTPEFLCEWFFCRIICLFKLYFYFYRIITCVLLTDFFLSIIPCKICKQVCIVGHERLPLIWEHNQAGHSKSIYCVKNTTSTYCGYKMEIPCSKSVGHIPLNARVPGKAQPSFKAYWCETFGQCLKPAIWWISSELLLRQTSVSLFAFSW